MSTSQVKSFNAPDEMRTPPDDLLLEIEAVASLPASAFTIKN